MVEAIVGIALLWAAIAVYWFAKRPSSRSSKRQREDAMRRYARDVEDDQ